MIAFDLATLIVVAPFALALLAVLADDARRAMGRGRAVEAKTGAGARGQTR